MGIEATHVDTRHGKTVSLQLVLFLREKYHDFITLSLLSITAAIFVQLVQVADRLQFVASPLNFIFFQLKIQIVKYSGLLLHM